MNKLKLKDREFRFLFIQLCFSLFIAALWGYGLYQFVKFVEMTKEISIKFHNTPSYTYDYGQQTAYYGCVCGDLQDTVVCTKCVEQKKSHVIPDTPEQLFQRSLHHVLVYTCPQSAVVDKTASSSLCRDFVTYLLRAVLYSQEEILSWIIQGTGWNSFLLFLYYFPYYYWHRLLDRNSSMNAAGKK